ncbi:LOW QUALITY PROTEIN: acyl-coenzyme A synthetase ACSM4, mitochondrial-like [Megaptera novaeangliae]
MLKIDDDNKEKESSSKITLGPRQQLNLSKFQFPHLSNNGTSSAYFIRLPSGQCFHKGHQLWAPLTLADFEAINRCERSLPKNFDFAGDVLDQWSQKEKTGDRPANPALWVNGKGDEVKWSFGELSSLSRKAANVLIKPCSLERGDRVAVILPQIPEWWLINMACMRTGLVFVPGTTQLTAKDILHWLQASKVKCTVASEEVIPAVESIVSECPGLKTKFLLSPHSQNRWLSFQELFQTASAEHSCVETGSQEPMAIYFTSGTTGSPKMAQHFQSSLGIGYTLCGSYPIMTLCSAPTVYWMLVQKDLNRYKFKKLRHCLMGGEPLNPEVLAWKVQTGLMLYKGYGQTVGIICANQKGQEIKPGSVGKGVLPYDVQVVKAFVVLSAPFKSSNPEKLTLELQDHVKKSTAPYKCPRKVEFVKELPKTITGKIKHNVLRDHEWG